MYDQSDHIPTVWTLAICMCIFIPATQLMHGRQKKDAKRACSAHAGMRVRRITWAYACMLQSLRQERCQCRR
eukprot:4848508-Pleurochrysis_carterae.AAC.1